MFVKKIPNLVTIRGGAPVPARIAPLIPLMDLITTWLLLLEQFLQFHVIMEGNFYMLKRSDMITDHIGING